MWVGGQYENYNLLNVTEVGSDYKKVTKHCYKVVEVTGPQVLIITVKCLLIW